METLSGLTPGLSKRLQRQLLAQLPPAAARTLRRTLSMNSRSIVTEKPKYARSLSVGKPADQSKNEDTNDNDLSSTNSDKTDRSDISALQTDVPSNDTPKISPTNEDLYKVTYGKLTDLPIVNTSKEDMASVSLYSTLPRLKRDFQKDPRSTDYDSPKNVMTRSSDYPNSKLDPNIILESNSYRPVSIRSTPDRSVLSKYFNPDSAVSLDSDPGFRVTSPEPGSLLTDPSYLAAYGSNKLLSRDNFKRRSLKVPGETSPRRRISRFLRPDFFDATTEENIIAREKKERELETQRILKEIREKRSQSSEFGCVSPRSPISTADISKIFGSENDRLQSMNSLSPSIVTNNRTRSRSLTPFSPILDNINEINFDRNSSNDLSDTLRSINNALEDSNKLHSKEEKDVLNNNIQIPLDYRPDVITVERSQSPVISNNKIEHSPSTDSKIARPKSFPSKSSETLSVLKAVEDVIDATTTADDNSNTIIPIPSVRESKIARPKSYPTTTTSPEKTCTKLKKKNKPESDKNIKSSTNIEESTTPSFKLIPETSKTEDDNGNITVSFNVNLPQKVLKKKKVDITKKDEEQKELKKKSLKKKKKIEPSNSDVPPPTKKSVSKSVLGLFKKTDSKEKQSRSNSKESSPSTAMSKPDTTKQLSKEIKDSLLSTTSTVINDGDNIKKSNSCTSTDKPKRPTSLLLNGFGKKTQPRYTGAGSDSVLISSDQKERARNASRNSMERDEPKSQKKSLRLDFSRLPRLHQSLFQRRNSAERSKSRESSQAKELPLENDVKQSTVNKMNQEIKIVDCSSESAMIATETKNIQENSAASKSVDKSTMISNGIPSIEDPNWSPDYDTAKYIINQRNNSPPTIATVNTHQPQRHHENTSPDPENVIDRIRRKSFYTRFNEKASKRKSSLVGPGAKEYNPSARIHSQSDTFESPYDKSPTSEHSLPHNFDSTKHFKTDYVTSPTSPRLLLPRSDIYRSLDRSEMRKPSLDYKCLVGDNLASNSIPRYSRTVSLFDDSFGNKSDRKMPELKYGRTYSMYSPGNYATYSPRSRNKNTAILLKEEEERESSPENILARIKERKKAIQAAISSDAGRTTGHHIRSTSTSKDSANNPETTEKVN